MSNDVNHSIAFCELGWEPLKTLRKKAKAKMMYKLLNKMGPKSLTNPFSYAVNVRKQTIAFGTFQLVFV
jgi:hypothetical protein